MDDQLRRVAEELRRRQETIHEIVACPRCWAGVGERCKNMGRGKRDRSLKHAHVERLRAGGIPSR